MRKVKKKKLFPGNEKNETMNHKIIILLFSIFILSCSDKTAKKEKGLRLDETELSHLVFASDINNLERTILLDSILRIASTDSALFCRTVRYFEKIFSYPNSNFRDEKNYSKLLQAITKSKWFDNSAKSHANSMISLLQQNNVGNAANDFYFITPEGIKRNLYDITSKFIMIFFYNPECDACKLMQDDLMQSWLIQNKVLKEELSVIALYTDKDNKVWRRHLLDQPKKWIQGRDENGYLYKNQIYDLKAIPSIYLLDSRKNVILKDCISIEDIEEGILTFDHEDNLRNDHN